MSSEKRKRKSTRTPPVAAVRSDSSSERELIIDLPSTSTGGGRTTRSSRPITPKKTSPDKRPPSTRKKRRRPRSSSSSSDVEDQTLEETIQRVAVSNNMSQESIKKILKKLVLNEHILATVKLKEEEEVREANTHPVPVKDGMEGDDEEEDSTAAQVKLTRLKAKQLNKPPLPIVPLKAPIANEEVAALIREELGSDDDDEEYQPTEDDIPSDDDPNTTISDIDSQPRTPIAPSTPGGTETEEESTLYSRDGLFKVPRIRNDSYCSEQEQENIARRTRSKLCLQTTAIETIESTFFPPDITTDMYDFDCDMDHVWKEFLSEFTKPLPNHAEDDDDTDPEYVAADQVPVDAEELREVKVSRKELNELVSELLEMSGIIDESFLNDATPNNTLVPGGAIEAPSSQDQDQLSQEVEDTGQSSVLNTPQPKLSSPVKERSVSPERIVNNSVFQPETVSTPVAPLAENRVVLVTPALLPATADVQASGPECGVPSVQLYTAAIPSVEGNVQIVAPVPQQSAVISEVGETSLNSTALAPVPQPTTPTVQPTERRIVFITPGSQTNGSTWTVISTSPGNSILQSSSSFIDQSAIAQTSYSSANNSQQLADAPKSLTLSGNFFLQIATPDESSFYKYYIPSKTFTVPQTDRTPVPPSERRYRFTHSLVPVTVTYHEGQTGFTSFQLQIFQQQLRQHVQFAAQSFMQSYAHPKFWQMAKTFKEMLLELQQMATDNPSAKAWNLDGAVECCLSWEKELEADSDENKDFIQFQLDEVSKAEKAKKLNKYYQGFFHPKMMEHVVNNPVFMYPKMLPYTPFRTDLRSESRFIKAEERLIAFGLEMFFYIAKKELNKHKPHVEKDPTVMQVCRYISKYLITCQTDKQLYSYISTRRQRGDKMNPIKYYFTHSKGPVFQHILESTDFSNVIPPVGYQKGELPHLWDKYIYSKERLAKLSNSKQADPEVITIHESVQDFSKRSQPAAAAVAESVPETPPPALNITISLVIDPHQPPIPLNQDFAVEEKEQDKDKSIVESDPPPPYLVEIKEESSISIDDDSRDLGDFDDHPDVSVGAVTEKNSSCGCNCHHLDHSHRSSECQFRTKSDTPKGQKRLTDYFSSINKNVSANDLRKTRLKEKLWEIYQRFRDSCLSEIDAEKIQGRTVRKVFDRFRLIEGFSCFLEKLQKMSSSHGSKKMDVIMAKNEHSMSNEMGSRGHRSSECEHRDANFAYNFFEKVEETLLSENKHSMYESFLDILQTFNAAEDRVPDLYQKIENLLLEDHPDLVDLFLTFLLPGQAAEVGRFFEHFILTNANDFLAKLNIYFAKQPAQIRKIYSCLNDLSCEEDVTMECIKSRILPLLKGNPLLIEWFLQLFPLESPTEGNTSDYEVISIKKLPHADHPTDPDEVYEEVPFVDLAPETAGESTVCGTKYIQGRIMYGTQPARLTFLAHDCMTTLSSAATQRGENPGLKGCVHNVRSVDNRPKATTADGGESGTTASDGREPLPQTADHTTPEEVHQQHEDSARYKLCDEATFNAHAIRLNPLVHGVKGVTYADVAHLLVPDMNVPDESQQNLSEDDRSNSPKKQQIKTVPKKRINSPVSKKPATGKNSPTACKKAPFSVSPDSKALLTSKKLKQLIESSPAPANAPEPSSSSSTGVKRKALPVASATPSSSSSSSTITAPPTETAASVPIKKERCDESESKDCPEQPSPTSWTRDEDKVILEEIKTGYSSVEQLVERIGMKIQGRSATEIRLRYEFLMEVLKKFQRPN
ncbi:uncharacterized protein LOC109401056 isoform X2 [Aedes albopictus]|uniref:Myb-like domain-containing protein n=1 Tax=Aedes albopictus TaxID=7160 RepID=A0ABM1ZVC0_AEDAL